MENDDLFDFEFDKTEKCWSITGYYGKTEEVIFPASYKGKPVKKIACDFSNNQKKRIKRVIIPEGYTSIEHEVFGYCKGLTNIKFPKSLTSIGPWAFTGCKGLTNIELHENITSIGDAAFGDCTGLTSIKLPKNLTSIGEWAFQVCTGLTSIELPEGLTCIEGGVFVRCTGLTNIKFPKSLISIGGKTSKGILSDDSGCRAFADCTGLTNIKLPEGLTLIGENTFKGCTGLTNIKFPKSLTSIEAGAFDGCTGLTNIILPENLTSIENDAFNDCAGLTNIKLPKSLNYIGDRVFGGCKNLTEITVDKNNSVFCAIDGVLFDKAMTALLWFPEGKKGSYSVPDGITEIKFDAFGNNCRLTGISFPKSLQYVDSYALNEISKRLTNITVSELNPECCSIDGVLFDKDKSGLILYPRNKGKTDYVIPDGIQYIYDSAFYGCKHLVNIELPESIRFIGDHAFAECKCLKTITLSSKLRHAIEYKIRGRTKLQTVLISGNSRIGRFAFEGFEGQFIYRNMKSVTHKDRPKADGKLSEKEINDLLDKIITAEDDKLGEFDVKFYESGKCWIVIRYNGKSEEVIFPKSHKGKPVKEIRCSFSKNQRKRIKRVVIPEGYTYIGCSAFEDCKGLTEINLPQSLTYIGSWAFHGCTGLTSIKLPKNLISIGNNGDMPRSLMEYSFGDLGDMTFADCTGLKNIEFPESLTFIGASVFYGCTGLTEIKFPEGLTSIGEWAFAGCKNLETVTLSRKTKIEDKAFEGFKGQFIYRD